MSEAFVVLADTLVRDYDVVDLLQSLVDRCIDLFDASDAGLVLADGRGDLEVIASTSEHSALVEVLQLRSGEGPCVRCFETGTVVSVEDIGDDEFRQWPAFARAATDLGYRSVHAIPMRLRDQTLGALNLFRISAGELNPADARAAQALADVATIGILQERALREASVLSEQLQAALSSRVVIEQAKGVVAQTAHIDMDSAFRWLRQYAREHHLRLHEVARDVIAQTLEVGEVATDETRS